MGRKLVSKLSFKSLGVDLMQTALAGCKLDKANQPIKSEPGEVVAVGRLYGIVNKVELITTQYGDSMQLKGELYMMDAATGEVTDGSVMYVPRVAEQMFEPLLNGQLEPIKFALEVGVHFERKKDGSDGYQYDVWSALEPTKSDARSELEALFSSGSVSGGALPAPEAKGNKKKDAA